MQTRTFASIAVLSVAAGPGVASAQWVSFTDDTAGRLTLNAFADNPGGNPLLDGDEKDIAVGDLDLGVAPIDVDIQNFGGSDVFALLRNPGDGHFVDPWDSGHPRNIHVDPHDFGFIDVNNDGCLDLFMGLCTGWKVFIQDTYAVACLGDIDGDGVIGILDFLELLAAWGPNPGHPADGDGTVGIIDFLQLLGNWGPCV